MTTVVTAVRSLAAEVIRTKQDAREQASTRYPKLLDMKTADAKAVAELQEVMELLGKSPSDLASDMETIRRARELQDVIRRGCGLTERSEAAAKAVDEHMAETPRIVEERRQRLFELMAVQSELGGLYANAEKARRDLSAIKVGANADVLQLVELPDLK